jgi:hypothetical protein
MPPLPHHRAYGSVPRRFGGLSTHQRFHRKQTQTTEASFGEGTMQRFRRAQSPWSLWAENGRTGRPFGDVEASELASPVRGDNLRRNLALVEELKALGAALAARQISAGYAAKGGWGR